LYLPEDWAADGERRRKAGVPEAVVFRTKWQIALEQIDRALEDGVRKHVTLADAAYGDVTEFRDALSARGLRYVVGVSGQPHVWSPESDPQIQHRATGTKGRPRTRYRDGEHPPISIAELAAQLTYRKVTWREGSRGWQSSRFAAVRIRTAHKHLQCYPPGDEQWLLCEWPEGEPEPTKHWLSTLSKETSIRTLVRVAKLRWRVERDYQEMKQELGLDHYEGRTWRGFHHHAALCAVAHAFLALKRALFPPEEDQVDAADGAALPAADPPPAHRLLPALSQAR
jgi:SRSO17 transposase